jgi:ketosteroid isomerase-like protein
MSNGKAAAKASRVGVIRALGILASLLALSRAQIVRAQDVPLDSCKALATIEATASQRRLRFLLDTGATSSLLNAKSFPVGDATRVVMHSWNGASSANGREAGISDLAIGGHHLNAMSFLAVDLSDLERECGKEIDGIMGADLIRRLGLEIDLKKRVARFAADTREQAREFTDLSKQIERCSAAFNRSDEKAFGDCLDPEVALVVSGKDYHGRDEVLQYFDDQYFASGRSATMSINSLEYHAAGEVSWIEFEISNRFHDRAIRERGTALFEKSGAKWLVVDLHHSIVRED